MSSPAPPFHSIAIVGIGLIGGSIALAVREIWPSVRIVGVDRQAVLAHALGSGAIERGVERLEEMGAADLVILAAPVSQNVRLLADLGRLGERLGVVTDVGGTKRDIIAAAAQLAGGVTFIGGHPIGGAERGGFGFARPDLFRGRPWIFTPTAATDPALLQRLSAFVQQLGALPATLDADEHDRLMAFVSHLPQLTASALMDVVGDAATADRLRLAGRGLIDTTRLASSPANVWRDICAANADAIGLALDALIARLSTLRAGLEDGKVVDEMFDAARHWRTELMRGRD